MSRSLRFSLSVPVLFAFAASCSSPPEPGNSGGSGSGAGGSGTGGSTAGSGGTSTSGAGGQVGSGGASAGNGGTTATSGGSAGSGGDPGSAGSAGVSGSGGGGACTPSTTPFSFFVTSLVAMRELSGSQDGFGGDLRFGETGPGAGLRGADKICAAVAERSMPGNCKTWRAFLSSHEGTDGSGPVNAIDRIGEGPWYDRLGRILSNNTQELQEIRPAGAHEDIKDDLPNEDGVPNHNPDGMGEVDNHQFLTGSDTMGELYDSDPGSTCNSWTSVEGSAGGPKPRMGHSWPRSGTPFSLNGGPPMTIPPGGPGDQWISAFDGPGCTPGVLLVEMGPAQQGQYYVGAAGGYGGIYCFALEP